MGGLREESDRVGGGDDRLGKKNGENGKEGDTERSGEWVWFSLGNEKGDPDLTEL